MMVAAGVQGSSLTVPATSVHVLHRSGRDITTVMVLMTYNRPVETTELIEAIARTASAANTALIVAQSVKPGLQEPVDASIAAMHAVGPQLGEAVHLIVPHFDESGPGVHSPYGSKRNAWHNLFAGLRTAFDMYPQVTAVVVLEDDVLLAPDWAEYFAAAVAAMARFPHVYLATALCELRPGLFTGHHLQFISDWIHPTSPTQIHVLPVTPRTVFKTFAWALNRRGWEAVQTDMWNTVMWEAESLPPSMSSCVFCENFCYDHFIEHIFEGSQYLVPAVARVSQRPGSGMTYANNPTNEVFDSYVERSAFQVAPRYRDLAWFHAPGVSTVPRFRPIMLLTLLLDEPWIPSLLTAIGSSALVLVLCLARRSRRKVHPHSQ